MDPFSAFKTAKLATAMHCCSSRHSSFWNLSRVESIPWKRCLRPGNWVPKSTEKEVGKCVWCQVDELKVSPLIPHFKPSDAIPRGLRNAFQVLATGERKDTLVFCTATEEDRTKWVDAYTTAIKSANNDKENKKLSPAGLALVKMLESGAGGMGGEGKSLRFMGGSMSGRKSGHSRSASGTSLRPRGWVGIVCFFFLDRHSFANQLSMVRLLSGRFGEIQKGGGFFGRERMCWCSTLTMIPYLYCFRSPISFT